MERGARGIRRGELTGDMAYPLEKGRRRLRQVGDRHSSGWAVAGKRRTARSKRQTVEGIEMKKKRRRRKRRERGDQMRLCDRRLSFSFLFSTLSFCGHLSIAR